MDNAYDLLSSIEPQQFKMRKLHC